MPIPASSPEGPLLAHPVQTAAGCVPALPSDPVSHTHNSRASSTVLPVKVQALSPDCCRDIQGVRRKISSCALMPAGLAHLPRQDLKPCQVLSSLVLQGVRGRSSSLTLVTPGRETFLSTAGSKGWRGRACFPHLCHCMADMRVGGNVRSPGLIASGSTHLSSHYRFSSSVLSR